jgi:hypothetical protein
MMDWPGEDELVDAGLLDELLAAARRGDPITCGVCGGQVDPADTVEALIPDVLVRFDGIAEPFEVIVDRVDRVCSGCAVFARPPDSEC